MMQIQHFVSVSGGKDSTATACIAKERAEKRGFAPRYLFADTGNENQITLDHIGYLAKALGITIETVRADFTAMFEARRSAIRRDWCRELRRKQHTRPCLAACKDLAYAERALIREECECPIKISPPLPSQLIERAIAMMVPTGNPFLDMAMLHGRFPGSQSRFCTDELKLQPMALVRDLVRLRGITTVEWIGTRADESESRSNMLTVAVTYVIVDIGLRMLTPRELARAQGFPDSYVLDPVTPQLIRGKIVHKPLTKAAQIRMIGNSVCPDVARALVAANQPGANDNWTGTVSEMALAA